MRRLRFESLECLALILNSDMPKNPDFYLAAAEYEPLRAPRACTAVGRLRDQIRDDYMLIEIDPLLNGQMFGLGSKDISLLILSTRHKGLTLFPIMEWPCFVYVTRILDVEILECRSFESNQVELIAWAMLYQTLEEAFS
jgi:hypothetical protein